MDVPAILRVVILLFQFELCMNSEIWDNNSTCMKENGLETLGWSLLGDKLTVLLTLLQEKLRYSLVPLLIMIYPTVLKLLSLMKCYKHVFLKKKGMKQNDVYPLYKACP